jgi:xylose isomerase
VFVNALRRLVDAGKLFHIDLNDQAFGRYDQDFRFGAVSLKNSFFLVKLLEDNGYKGSRHFDAHAYRTENYEGVKDFARGCMRSYLILKEKVQKFNTDAEIQGLLKEINQELPELKNTDGKYTPEKMKALKDYAFDRKALSDFGMKYEKLDQLTNELLWGIR